MRIQWIVIVCVVFILGGCKAKNSAAADSGSGGVGTETATVPLEPSAPLIDTPTQEANAASGVTAAGWSEADLIAVTGGNAMEATNSTLVAELASSISMSGTATASGTATSSGTARIVAKQAFKSILNKKIFAAATPYSSAVDVTSDCSTSGTIKVLGTTSGSDDTTLDAAAGTFTSVSESSTSVTYTADACKDVGGYTSWGAGKYLETFAIAASGTATTYTIKITETTKSTDGMAVLTPAGQKFKLAADAEGRIVVDQSGTIDSLGNFTPTAGSMSVDFIGTVNGVLCKLAQTYTMDELSKVSFNPMDDVSCL